VVSVGVRTRRIVPLGLRVAPHRAVDPVRRLPVIPGMNVPVQHRQRVAEHLVVDPAQPVDPAGAYHGRTVANAA